MAWDPLIDETDATVSVAGVTVTLEVQRLSNDAATRHGEAKTETATDRRKAPMTSSDLSAVARSAKGEARPMTQPKAANDQ